MAYDLLPLLQKEAKDRQRLSKGRGKKGRNVFRTLSGNGEATEIAARIAKSNACYVKVVKNIATSAPDVVTKIRTGELTVTDAEWIAKLPPGQRRKLFQGDMNEDALRRWKYRQTKRNGKPVAKVEGRARIAATELIHGDCRQELQKIRAHSGDAIISDPPYPEAKREYGTYTEAEWHDMMRDVVAQCRRVLDRPGKEIPDDGETESAWRIVKSDLAMFPTV